MPPLRMGERKLFLIINLTETKKCFITLKGKDKKMNIIREFKRPMSDEVVVAIPKRFVNTEIEILIIPVKENVKKKKRSIDRGALFNKLCGLWEDRKDLTLESIRSKAWKREQL